MSYILDALKKADAARERGQVPGLRSQSMAGAAPTPRAARSATPLGLIVGLVLMLAAAAVGWWLNEPGTGTEPPVVAMPQPVATAPAQNAPLKTPPPPPTPALPILAPEPPRPVAQNPAPARAAVTPPAPRTSPAGSPTASPAGDTQANPPAAPVRSFAELAPEIRAQLPQVSVSGSTYSSNPAHRMLIANGKVVHEGEEIAPGLQLETISPGKAVLNHRGTRYSIGY